MAATSVTVGEATGLVAQLGGLAILAGTLAALVAVAFRWYAAEQVPRGLAMLAGLSGVALYLNTTSALAEVISRQGGPTETQVALFNIVAFAVGAAGAEVGRRVGDRFETDVFLRDDATETDEGVGRLGRALGRVVEVQLPAEIDDVVGYDPVEEATKETLAGRTFVFPRGLSVDELESRLVGRLRSDYGVGTVDVDLAADGTIEHLGVGRRAAGIGPTLPPATNAVAVQADPPFAASAGDLVQLWETDPARRVLTGELRGVAGDTVTLAIDAADTPKVDPETAYRLVTLPVEDRPDREFASLLRAADETYTSVEVAAGSPLAGVPIGALSVSIVAVADEAGATTALPTPDIVVEPGAVLFAIGTPDRLRRLKLAATALPETIESTTAPKTGSRIGETGETEPGEADQRSATTRAAGGSGEGAAGGARPASGQATKGEGGTEESGDAATAPDQGVADAPAGGETAGTDDETESTPPSFEELASDLDEEQSLEPSGADEASDGVDGGGEAEEPTSEATTATDAGGDDGSREDDLEELAFVDDEKEAGGDLDDLEALSVGEDDDAGEEPGGLEDFTFGKDADEPTRDDEGPDSEDAEEAGEADEGEADAGDAGEGAADAEDGDEGEGTDAEGEQDDGQDADDGDGSEEGNGADADSDGDGTDSDEDDGDGGGGTFSQLKEEFESGDADWADDISDSPGGDMRLDE